MPDVNKSYKFPASLVDKTYNITIQPDNSTTVLANTRLETPITITQTVDKKVDIKFSVKSNDFSTAIGFTSGTINAQTVQGTLNTSSSSVRTLSWSVTKPSAGAWIKYRDFVEDDFKTVSGGTNIIKFESITTSIDSSSPNPLLITAKIIVDQFVADEEIVLDVDNAVGVETDFVFTYNVPSGVNYTYNTGENITITGQSGSDISKVATYQKFINFKLTPASGYSWSSSNLPTSYPDTFELVSGGSVVTDKYLEHYASSIDSSGNLLLGYKLKQNIFFLTADTTITLQPKSGVSFNASNNVASNTNIIVKITDSSGNKLTGIKYSNTSSNSNSTILEKNIAGIVSTQYTDNSIALDNFILPGYTFKGLATPSISVVSRDVTSLSQSVSIDSIGMLDLSIQFTPSQANPSIEYTIVAVNPVRQFVELKVGDNYTSFNSSNADPVVDTQKYFIKVDAGDLKIGDSIFKTVDSSFTTGVDNTDDGFVASNLAGTDYIIEIIGGKVISIEPRKVQKVITPPTMSGIQVVNNTMTSFGLQFDVGSYGSTKQGVYGYIVYTSTYDGLSSLSGKNETDRNTYLRDTTPSVIPSSYLSSSTAPSNVSYSVVENLYFHKAKGFKNNLTTGSQTLTAKKPQLSNLVDFPGKKNNSQGQSVSYQPTIYARVYLQNKDGSWMWSEQVEVPEVLDGTVVAQNIGGPTSITELDHGSVTVEFGNAQSDGTYEALIKSSLTKATPGDNTYLGLVLSEDDANYPVTAVTPTSYPKDVTTNHVIHIWKNESYSLDSGTKFGRFLLGQPRGGETFIDKTINNPSPGMLISNPFTTNVPNSTYSELHFWLHIEKGLIPGKKYNYQVFAFKQNGIDECFPPFFKNSYSNYRATGAGYKLKEFKSGTLTGANARTGYGYGHPRDVYNNLLSTKYGPFEFATVVSNSNGNGSFTVPAAAPPELSLTVSNTEINYTEIQLNITNRGSVGTKWKESGIIISESTLSSPRNATKAIAGNKTGTIHNVYKDKPLGIGTNTLKVPFWATDVNQTAFNSISSEKRNWPYVDGITNPPNIVPSPNSAQVPAGGLEGNTAYNVNWYVLDMLGNYHVGSQPKSFTTKKALMTKYDYVYSNIGTVTDINGNQTPAVCCPKIAKLKNDKTIITDCDVIEDSTKVLTGGITSTGGNPAVATISSKSTFFRTDKDAGYFKWDGTTFSSGTCGGCPSTSLTPSGVPLAVPAGTTIKSKISQDGLYQPCTLWNTSLTDAQNLQNASFNGWKNGKILWVKLKETDTVAYDVGTQLTVKDQNGNNLTVKVGVPNWDISGGFNGREQAATSLVPLISSNSTLKVGMPRNFGQMYDHPDLPDHRDGIIGPNMTMTNPYDSNKSTWNPQFALSQTQWDISTAKRQGSSSSLLSRSKPGRRKWQQSNLATDGYYDFWDYQREFSWNVVNDSTYFSNDSNIFIDGANSTSSLGGVWYGTDGVKSGQSFSNQFGTFPLDDYNLIWKKAKTSNTSGGKLARGWNVWTRSAWDGTEYNKSWFYQFRPTGDIKTFERPYQDDNGIWQYPDSSSSWSQAEATAIIGANRRRWIQLGLYRLGGFGGYPGKNNQHATWGQGYGNIDDFGANSEFAKEWSSEVFGSLFESGYVPSAITGSLVTSGWGGLGGNVTLGSKPSQLNKTTFNVPQNAGPLYLAKFDQTVDGFPARGVVDRGFQYGSKGDGKYWTGNAFYDKTNSFWFTMGRNVWSYGELKYKGQWTFGYATSDAHVTYKDQIARGQFVEL